MSHLKTVYQEQIAKSKYARWDAELGRREHWEESADRYLEFMFDHANKLGWEIPEELREELSEQYYNTNVSGSMRALMTAGPALDRDHAAGYNCSYIAVDYKQAFDECMYILSCGTGVGFSVEQQHVSKLPEVPEELFPEEDTIVVADSKIGWASSYRRLINALYGGSIPKWDVSKVRPAGAPLKTFGGRASGPEPLVELFQYTVDVFVAAQGRKLSSLECHGLMCKVAQSIVVGGVRRSALISLSDLNDDKMRKAKSGSWYNTNGEYALANNSAVYNQKPTPEEFLQEWTSLIESKSGERGIVNRKGLKRKAAENGRRDSNYEFGMNPCAEIILRSKQFCNLSEAVIRPEDDYEEVARKVELATILGTIQSSLTDFRYLSKEWKKNCEEERLLGVSLTGIYDNPHFYTNTLRLQEDLKDLRQVAVDTNDWVAEKLGINASVAVTCNKPSGTKSKKAECANGIHPWPAKYFVNTNRFSNDDPVGRLLTDEGFHTEIDVTNPRAKVISFPRKAPEDAVVVDDVGAIDQLELWLTYSKYWCEHNPSITVYVAEDEWVDVAAWIYSNWDYVNGVSFLPKDDHVYKQAPYQPITETEYEEWVEKTPKKINWDLLAVYELEDMTEGVGELSCVAGGDC